MTNKSGSIDLSSRSAKETYKIAQTIGNNLKGGEIIELISDLGSGKTTFVKGLSLGAGCSELVSSPSFTICNEYVAKKFKIYHFDFYRLNNPGIIRRELSEVMTNMPNVIVIEWPEVIENILPNQRIAIKMSVNEDNSRSINVSYPDELSYLMKGLI